MREIADGTPSQNALRWMSRFAPSAGVMQSMGTVGGGGTLTAATGNPLFLAPAVMGEGAKYAAERMTRNQVGDLGELIRNGQPLPKKEMSDGVRRIAAALMAKQAASAPPVDADRQIVVNTLLARQAAQ